MGPGAPGTATAAYRNGAPFYNAWPRSHSPFPNQLRVPPVPVILSNLDEGAPGPSLLGTGEGSSHFTVHVFAIEVFSQCRKGAHPLSANRCATGYATLLPGPRVRGTGGTLNLIEFLRRPWPPAKLIQLRPAQPLLFRFTVRGIHSLMAERQERMCMSVQQRTPGMEWFLERKHITLSKNEAS